MQARLPGSPDRLAQSAPDAIAKPYWLAHQTYSSEHSPYHIQCQTWNASRWRVSSRVSMAVPLLDRIVPQARLQALAQDWLHGRGRRCPCSRTEAGTRESDSLLTPTNPFLASNSVQPAGSSLRKHFNTGSHNRCSGVYGCHGLIVRQHRASDVILPSSLSEDTSRFQLRPCIAGGQVCKCNAVSDRGWSPIPGFYTVPAARAPAESR